MLAYTLYLLYKYVLSLSLIHARPCPMKSWHLCDTSTAAICPLDFSVSHRYVQIKVIKDQGSDIPTQAFSKNCLDIFIAKSGGSRHLQGLTARSGNSFNSNLKSRGRKSKRGGTTRGKHTNRHTDFACLLQLLPRMRLPENFLKALQWTRARHLQWKTSDLTIHLRMLAYALYLLYKNVLSLIYARPCPMKSWHLRDTSTAAICPLHKKIKDLTFQYKAFRTNAWTSLLPRAVELGICKDSRRGLGILSTLT